MNKEMFCRAARELNHCSCIMWTYIVLTYAGRAAFTLHWKEINEHLGISRPQFYLSINELKEKEYLTYDAESRTYSLN